MKSSLLAFAFAALATLGVAAPAGPPSYDSCISQADAETLVKRYAAVIAQQPCDIGSPTVCAKAIAARGYQEFSDSANSNIGIPLGDPTAATKQAFVRESQANPPLVTETQDVIAACNKVTWRWISFNFGSGEYEVKGIHVFELASSKQIQTAYFEFNIVAGLLDDGYTINQPDGSPLVVIPQGGS